MYNFSQLWRVPQAGAPDTPVRRLFRGIATIDEDGLPGHPPSFRHKEADMRGDVLDIRQAGLAEGRQGGGGFMISHGLF